MSKRDTPELGRVAMARLGIKVFSPDYQILVHLYERGSATSGELRALSDISPASFQTHLRDLGLRDMVRWDADHADSRRRRYYLSDSTRVILDDEFTFSLHWKPSTAREDAAQDLREIVQRLRSRLGLRFFTCEYQIILWIYNEGPLRVSELLERSEASPRSFYNALRHLTELGMLLPEGDAVDQRRKRYAIAPWVQQAMDGIYAGLDEWIEEYSNR